MASPVGCDQLTQLFAATLDPATQKQAETQLNTASFQQGFSQALLQVWSSAQPGFGVP